MKTNDEDVLDLSKRREVSVKSFSGKSSEVPFDRVVLLADDCPDAGALQ